MSEQPKRGSPPVRDLNILPSHLLDCLHADETQLAIIHQRCQEDRERGEHFYRCEDQERQWKRATASLVAALDQTECPVHEAEAWATSIVALRDVIRDAGYATFWDDLVVKDPEWESAVILMRELSHSQIQQLVVEYHKSLRAKQVFERRWSRLACVLWPLFESYVNRQNIQRLFPDRIARSTSGDEMNIGERTTPPARTPESAEPDSVSPGERAKAKALDLLETIHKLRAVAREAEPLPETDSAMRPLALRVFGADGQGGIRAELDRRLSEYRTAVTPLLPRLAMARQGRLFECEETPCESAALFLLNAAEHALGLLQEFPPPWDDSPMSGPTTPSPGVSVLTWSGRALSWLCERFWGLSQPNHATGGRNRLPGILPADQVALRAELGVEYAPLLADEQSRKQPRAENAQIIPAAQPPSGEPTLPARKGKNIDARMLKLLADDWEAVGWTAAQWAIRLKCSPSTVKGTKTWTERLRANRAEQVRGRTRNMDRSQLVRSDRHGHGLSGELDDD